MMERESVNTPKHSVHLLSNLSNFIRSEPHPPASTITSCRWMLGCGWSSRCSWCEATAHWQREGESRETGLCRQADRWSGGLWKVHVESEACRLPSLARLVFLHWVHSVILIFSSWALIGDSCMIDDLKTPSNPAYLALCSQPSAKMKSLLACWFNLNLPLEGKGIKVTTPGRGRGLEPGGRGQWLMCEPHTLPAE